MVVVSENRCDDRLSNLPEVLLTSILSMMPTKQAATTSVLSKRWRYHWHSVTHLHILHENLSPTSDDDNRSAVGVWQSMMNSIDLSVRGPILSCRISFVAADCYILRMNGFLVSLVEKGIRELSVARRGVGCYELPAQIFFCQTLEKLELDRCMISVLPLSSPIESDWNKIKKLVLVGVYFTDDHFRKVISCCRLLESLTVDCCERVRSLRIEAPRLEFLEIVTLRRMRILLADVARLRWASFRFRFELSGSIQDENGDEADHLIQLLMGLSQCDHLEGLSLQFSPVFTECLQFQGAGFPLSLPPQYQFPAVKKLELEMSLGNCQVAAFLSCLLNICPMIHELRIQDANHQDATNSFWESQNPAQCFSHLRIVQICRVNLKSSSWLGLVRYLAMNARACERVTIHYSGDPWDKGLVEQKFKTIQWASPRAVLELNPLS